MTNDDRQVLHMEWTANNTKYNKTNYPGSVASYDHSAKKQDGLIL